MQFAKQLSLGIIIVLLTTQVSAQEKDIELSNITITASLLEQQQKETGRNIITIQGESFYSLPVSSIDELLRYIPGVEVQQRGPQGSQSNIILRGGTFQQVLVIIDGVKLNDPITGHFNSYVPIHPSEIERIEVLKGAASAIYGSEAVGGVINIITKTFAGKISNNKKLRLNVAAGENKLLNAGTHFQYAKNNSSFSAGVTTTNAKGEQLRGTTGFFHSTTASIAFSHQFKNNWRASIRAAADFRKFNAQNFYTTFSSDTANEEVNSLWSQLNINKKTKNGLLNIDLGYKKLRDQFWFRPAAIPNDNRSNLYTAQVYYNWNINMIYSITPGVQFIEKKIESNDRGNHSIAHGAFYTIFRQQFADNIFLNESL
ncbi:MAG: TonB-dependent receptor plug domain-containing protein, partial [Chitinophagaceae bacterium]